MSHGGQRRAEYVRGKYQRRVCECPRPQAFWDTEGRCVKCGHVAVRVERDSTRELLERIARLAA